MIQPEHLKRYLAEFEIKKLPDTLKRDIDVDLSLNKVIILAGIRRSGKTYELYNIMKYLLKNGVSEENILYVNFEDERLLNFQSTDFDLLLDTYKALFRPNKKEKIYLFLDEIQIVENWEKAIRRLYESNKYKLFLTGSSSKLLSSEISTLLAGRNITYIIYPFSFSEMVRSRGIVPEGKDFYRNLASIKAYAKEFIIYGGFPEIIQTNNSDSKKRILSSYYESIIFRDMAERYHINDIGQLKIVLSYIMNSYSTNLSVSNLYNFMKSIGMEIGKNTISKILDYAENVFFVSLNYKYSKGFKVRTQSRKKVYIMDIGFTLLFKTSDDMGRLLENVVYIELLRRREKNQFKEIYYYQGKGEADFLITNNNKIAEVIQVCYELNESNFQRESRSIHKAMSTFGIVKGTIITMEESSINLTDKNIKIIPFYKWSLEIET